MDIERTQFDQKRSRDLVLFSPVAMLVTHGPGNEVELVNLKFMELFGYTIEDVPDEAHWWPLAYPDEVYREEVRREWQERIQQATSLHRDQIEPMEAIVQCKDGAKRHIEFHFAFMGDTSLVSFIDMTERRRAEEAVKESERRFRLIADTAPVLMWMSGTDKLCSYFNKPWLDFTGRPIESELGNGWAEGVHSEDLQRCLATYMRAFDRSEQFRMEYRLRRYDGEYRWVLDIGVPRFDPAGSFAGYIGVCVDVTERKRAEQTLANISARLIEAQEEERRRIARELHDDINQRIALIAVELEQSEQRSPKSKIASSVQVRHARERLQQLGKDIQGLSHRLHSAQLDVLGIETAARSFCKELSEKHNVVVNFSHQGIPRSLPSDVSLCFFRVLQEALHNAVKYSGVVEFHVDLRGNSGEIQLTVNDQGAGFDQESTNGSGLGLISMRERLQLVHGELLVNSKLGGGTTITARVPLKAVLAESGTTEKAGPDMRV